MIKPKGTRVSPPNPLLNSPEQHLVNPLCRDCALWETCSHVCVPGRGATGRLIDAVLVGQAPGQVEDETGICFTGSAGLLLTDVLEAEGVTDFKIRFENVCRCAPPNDRKPRAHEIKACIWRTLDAIARHEPRVVVPMGDIALKALTGLQGIGAHAGRPIERDGITYFPTLHPSAVLHRPKRASEFESQMRALARYLRSGGRRGPVDVDWRLLMTIEEIEDHFAELVKWRKVDHVLVGPPVTFVPLGSARGGGPVAFDYETTSTDPGHDGARVRIVSYCFEEGRARAWPLEAGGPITSDVVERARRLHAAWLRSGRPKIAHTATFESKWARHWFGAPLNTLVFDTKLAHHLLHEASSHSLSHLAGEYTSFVGYDDWMESYKTQVGDAGKAYATAPIVKLAWYGCGDAEATYLSYKALARELSLDQESEGLTKYLNDVLLPAVPVVGEMEHRGLYISQAAADRVRGAVHRRLEEIEGLIGALPDVATWWRRRRAVNLRSDAHLRELLFRHLGLKTSVTTDSGRYSTGGEALDELSGEHPVVPLLMEWKAVAYLETKVDEMLRFRRTDGIVNPHFLMARAVTWRLASIKPQVQNLTKTVIASEDGDVGVRSLITPRGEGRILIEADYGQLEMRLLAHLAGDEPWLKAFKRGDDLHRLTAADVTGVKPERVTKAQRSAGKTINFSINYGQGAPALARSLKISRRKAERHLRQFWRRHPAVSSWIKAQHDHAREAGYVTNQFGVVRRLPDAQLEEGPYGYPREYDEALRQAQNFPVTSLGAGITMIAMTLVEREACRRGLEGGLINQNHDALLIDAYERDLDEWAELLRLCMVDRIHEIVDLNVQLVIDICVGSDWGSMKPLGG